MVIFFEQVLNFVNVLLTMVLPQISSTTLPTNCMKEMLLLLEMSTPGQGHVTLHLLLELFWLTPTVEDIGQLLSFPQFTAS